MDHFMNQLKQELLRSEGNFTQTENGALGYKSTGKPLLDLNFAVSSLRGKPPQETITMFNRAYAENPQLAIAWLFFARDIRGNGMGERRLFRVCLHHLACGEPDVIRPLIRLIPEYGRWDDLIYPLMDTPLEDDMMEQVCAQLISDKRNLAQGKPISLLAKWLPSVGASDKRKRAAASRIIRYFHSSVSGYKHTLSTLRRYLGVTECKMSENRWSEIDYSAVPSRANLNYNKAFLRHDEARRRAFLESVKKGAAKINAGTLYPHEIVAKYREEKGFYSLHIPASEITKDDDLELMWNALPDYIGDRGDTLVVCDTSGSMMSPVGGSATVKAIDVSVALAVYFATHMHGGYRNKYIQFAARPYFVELSDDGWLVHHLKRAFSHSDYTNTNLEAVFDLILRTAYSMGLAQDDMPKNILIISDMEFDAIRNDRLTKHPASAMDLIRKRYEDVGYKLPRVAFWNVCGRSGAIPMLENDLGVCLVSGFSPAIADMVLGGDIDPYHALIKAVTTPRYEPVWKALTAKE